ncbi:LysR substrate-binding domain-containing protein [Ottowia thiooxydans]|uniref:LysR substrate-binding domain-containing protein n=1 Tax=Ottowia thiooxydans TaxID=219182 RepID=UPI00041DB73F|nr:LysR substrate-binding domain-containing protein [Ottowia thiooxydans]
MSTFDLELLRSLVAIVAHGSFAAAAVQLGRTQSAITQQMQRLEEQIGHPLFLKHGRQKRLTQQGERLLTYARHMLAVNDEAMQSLRRGNVEGVLRIGAPHDMADTMLPPLLAEVSRNLPNLQLEIQIGRSPFLMEALKRSELDMTISNRTESEFEGIVLRNTPTVWLCGTSYIHDAAKPIPLIEADGPSIFRKMGQDALDAAGVAWTPRSNSTSLVGIRAALRAGLGVTCRGVEQLDSTLRVLGTADGLPPLPDLIYRLYVRSNVVSPLTRHAFEHLRGWLHPTAGRF